MIRLQSFGWSSRPHAKSGANLFQSILINSAARALFSLDILSLSATRALWLAIRPFLSAHFVRCAHLADSFARLPCASPSVPGAALMRPSVSGREVRPDAGRDRAPPG